MKILVVNPNTTASMTASIAQVARDAAANGTRVDAANPADGPASIEGYYDEVFSIPGLLAEIARGEREDYDGYVIACFDDTGLDAARCLARGPVVGLCEAATHMASMLGGRMTIVTTLDRSVPALQHLTRRYGVADYCTVRATNIPVLSLEDSLDAAERQIGEEIERALSEDRAETIILGCAGMATIADSLSSRYAVPVLDGVRCAVKQVEALVSLKLQTSKIGGYASPLEKRYSGSFKSYAPQHIRRHD